MYAELREAQTVAGARQLLRAIESGTIRQVYIATDADLFITKRVTDVCAQKGIPVREVPSMKALGEACGLAVAAAVAGIKR